MSSAKNKKSHCYRDQLRDFIEEGRNDKQNRLLGIRIFPNARKGAVLDNESIAKGVMSLIHAYQEKRVAPIESM